MAAASSAIRELDLEREGLSWIDPPHVLAHPFADGSAIALHRSVEATVASLGPAGPGWAAAMKQMLPLADPLVQSVLSPLPPLRPALRLAGGLRGELAEWTRKLLGSVEALGLDLFDGDERATAWLSGSAQHSGLPPSTTLSGAFGFLLQLMGHSHGWPLPRGGMGELAKALLRRAEREGVTIRCSATVRQLLVSGGRVAGVRLADGEQIAADAVISTVSAGVLARLVPDTALPHGLERRLRRWRYGTGAFKLDYALSAPVPWAAAEAREAAVVHVGGELHELTAAAQAGARGEMPPRPALVVGQQSLYDSSRAPAGGHTLYVYAHVPPKHSEGDEYVAELDREAARALRTRLRGGGAGTGDAHLGADRAGEPQSRRRGSRRRFLRARSAARLSPYSAALALPDAAEGALRRWRIHASGRRGAWHQRPWGSTRAAA